MKTDLFPSTLSKYYLEYDEEQKQSILDLYAKHKFEVDKPFIFTNDEVRELLSNYSEIIVDHLDSMSHDGSATITDVRLVVLGPGDSVDRDCHLPGHYTAVHYIKYEEGQHNADIYFNPSYDVLRFLGRNSDLVAGLWVKEGDVIIYPSYLHTSSPKNTSKEERITLMFTFVVDERREPSPEESPE